jgi:hypothetical protein
MRMRNKSACITESKNWASRQYAVRMTSRARASLFSCANSAPRSTCTYIERSSVNPSVFPPRLTGGHLIQSHARTRLEIYGVCAWAHRRQLGLLLLLHLFRGSLVPPQRGRLPPQRCCADHHPVDSDCRCVLGHRPHRGMLPYRRQVTRLVVDLPTAAPVA